MSDTRTLTITMGPWPGPLYEEYDADALASMVGAEPAVTSGWDQNARLARSVITAATAPEPGVLRLTLEMPAHDYDRVLDAAAPAPDDPVTGLTRRDVAERGEWSIGFIRAPREVPRIMEVTLVYPYVGEPATPAEEEPGV